ncbi:MAG: tolB [Marmoricola sp.]|nr:tolB [Marmoricola sp.]
MFARSRGRLCRFATAALLLAAAACGTWADEGRSTSKPAEAAVLAGPGAPRVPVSSDLIYIENDRVGVLVADGVKYKAVEGAPTGQDHPDWSRNGKAIVFDTGRKELWTAGSYGSGRMRIHKCRAPCLTVSDGAWSPDGNKIAFASTESEDGRHLSRAVLKVIDLRAAAVSAVYEDTSQHDRVSRPRWSRDGSSLVFEQDTYGSNLLAATTVIWSRIGVVPVKGGGARFLTSGRGRGPQTPDWGRSGIVFSRAGNLFVISPDGRSTRQLTSFDGTTEQAVDPTFSPDGKRVVFTYVAGGDAEAAAQPTAAVINAGGGGFALLLGADGLSRPRLKP